MTQCIHEHTLSKSCDFIAMVPAKKEEPSSGMAFYGHVVSLNPLKARTQPIPEKHRTPFHFPHLFNLQRGIVQRQTCQRHRPSTHSIQEQHKHAQHECKVVTFEKPAHGLQRFKRLHDIA
jgi:hypothetical protein